MVLINECLDYSDWPKETSDRLKLAEIAAWYTSDSDATNAKVLDSSVESAKKSKKTKDKSKVKGSSKRKDSEESDHAQPPSKKSKEDDMEWRSEINNTLSALASMVQQLATRSESNQIEQDQAPPVPPRSQEQKQLIEDVRNFISDNPQRPSASTPTPSQKSGRSVVDEETILKQRPLPKAPIPRKPTKEASGPQGQGFRFAATYEDFENLDHSYHDYDEVEEVEEFEDLNAPQPADLKEMDLGRLEKRKMYLSGLKNMVPDLEVTQPPTNKTGRFEFLDPRPKDNMMPFLEEMFQQISLVSVVRDRRPKDPFNLIPRFYPTTEPAESGVLQNRDVPKQLVNLVKDSKLVTQGTSGRKAQLRTSTPEGAKEEAARRSFKQASSYIRLVNNFEIDVEVMTKLSGQISSIVSDLENIKGLPLPAKAKVSQLSQKVRLIQKSIYDVKSTNSDFARASLYQYQSSLYDRRNAWIQGSMVLRGTAEELKVADYPRPTSSDSAGKLPMFGQEGTGVLTEYDELAKDGKVPTPQNPNPHNGNNNANQYRAGYFAGNHFGQGHGQSYSGGQNRRGQGQGNRARGGGRPANRRPRNNYRGGRGRGQHQGQPFRQANRPQNRE
jgi:hypothetical protein